MYASTSWDTRNVHLFELNSLMKASRKGGGEYWWGVLTLYGDKLAIGCSDNSTVFRIAPLVCLVLCEKSFSGSALLWLLRRGRSSSGRVAGRPAQTTGSGLGSNSDQNLTPYWSLYFYPYYATYGRKKKKESDRLAEVNHCLPPTFKLCCTALFPSRIMCVRYINTFESLVERESMKTDPTQTRTSRK